MPNIVCVSMTRLVKLRIKEAAQPAPEVSAPEEPAPAPAATPPATDAVPGPTNPAEAAEEQPGGELRVFIERYGRLS